MISLPAGQSVNMLTWRFAFVPPCGAAAPISDEWRKTLDLFLNFLYCVSAFRSRKVVVSFPMPEKREIPADIKR